jgi:hypothetical protein
MPHVNVNIKDNTTIRKPERCVWDMRLGVLETKDQHIVDYFGVENTLCRMVPLIRAFEGLLARVASTFSRKTKFNLNNLKAITRPPDKTIKWPRTMVTQYNETSHGTV